jgi:polar amino acid transport system substrate-binding protein
VTLGAVATPPVAAGEVELAPELAPAGRLRVGLWMLPYFAVEDTAANEPTGVIPDIGRALARRIGVPYEPVRIVNPTQMIERFSAGAVDVTFIGITADRAAAFDFGPVLFGIQTTFLVPAHSPIRGIEEIDRPGIRIAVPARSAQAAHLAPLLKRAEMLAVPPENSRAAMDLMSAGEVHAYSHVVPMLATVQPGVPGSRILPGSYYDVPIAIGYPKDRSAAAVAFYAAFVADMKSGGLAQQAIGRMGDSARGIVVMR